jgi:hypothetical protein
MIETNLSLVPTAASPADLVPARSCPADLIPEFCNGVSTHMTLTIGLEGPDVDADGNESDADGAYMALTTASTFLHWRFAPVRFG